VSVSRFIELEGGRVHNLQGISLKIAHHALTVICGLSGSGKSSLAFDTLYAEGQRRYIETFSPSARQFLDRIERPAADRISGLPPAIAIRQQLRSDGARNTLGTRSEVLDSLRLLVAQAGRQFCPACQIPIDVISAEHAAVEILQKAANCRVQICAVIGFDRSTDANLPADLVRQGFPRAIVGEKTVRMEELNLSLAKSPLIVVADRLKADSSAATRIAEAVHNSSSLSSAACLVLVESTSSVRSETVSSETMVVDGIAWQCLRYSHRRACPNCSRQFPELSADLLNFLSPLGACSVCEGTGQQKLAPPPISKRKRTSEKNVLSNSPCTSCHGTRLNEEARHIRWGSMTLPEIAQLELEDLTIWLESQFAALSAEMKIGLRSAYEHADRRLQFLRQSGLGYVSLDRAMKSLSSGEAQRVMLTSALGSGLINTLYVLDEPTAGLHASDTNRIINCVRNLQRAGNTVIVVEHDPQFILAADDIVEIGPGAGSEGGRVEFQGSVAQLLKAKTLTGEKLRLNKAQLSSTSVASRRTPEAWLNLQNANCHNIKGLNVDLPLGVFCAVTGVSGSGKSSLIIDTLYPAMCQHLKLPMPPDATGTLDRLEGADGIDHVVLLDQSPVLRSRRSIPATWIGVFDDIRVLLAETHEARKRNYSRAMFSFNAASGGRCPVCEGRGIVTVAMQFLADIETVCEECSGRRFRPEVLEVRYRDRSVFDILNMTADESFTFFNGHHRIQQRLNAIRQTGLGYLRLGQPLSTISGGEAQRLRIAAMLAGIPLADGEVAAENRKAAQLARSGRTLFLLDEPSVGLHMQDIERLVGCIEFLLQTGHSVVVIDHDQALISQADWEIELGPGPGKQGGRIVRSGPPA
jgi:excinuclease ABC subunit A